MHLSQTSPHTAEIGIQQRRKNWSPICEMDFSYPSLSESWHTEDGSGWCRVVFFYLIFQSGEAQTFSRVIHGYAVWRLWKLEKINSFGGVFHFLTPRGSNIYCATENLSGSVFCALGWNNVAHSAKQRAAVDSELVATGKINRYDNDEDMIGNNTSSVPTGYFMFWVF